MNKDQRTLLIQVGLFVITFITTTLAGAEWMFSKYLLWVDEPNRLTWPYFVSGMQFSIPFLLILTCHEFGHYFTARYHDIRTTLPYYIPLWLGFILTFSFGTMGAFIRIKDPIYRLKQYFDIGVSGPIAGFVVAMGFIWYVFTHLPEPEYIFQVHPEYEEYGLDYADHVYEDETISFTFGNNIIYWFFEEYVADPERMPNANEIIHYPYLLAGYLALFFTALNLLPIGQLDGGHILFAMAGPKRFKWISRGLFALFLYYAGIGIVTIEGLEDLSIGSSLSYLLIIVAYIYFLYICAYSVFKSKKDRMTFAAAIFTAQFLTDLFIPIEGYNGWLLFAFLLGRVLGVQHPPVATKEKLSTPRMVLGWIAFIIFILSFSPQPFILTFPGQ